MGELSFPHSYKVNYMAKNEDKRAIRCSFCGNPQSVVNRLIAGNGCYICDECVRMCTEIIGELANENRVEGFDGLPLDFEKLPRPSDIKAKLDEKNVEIRGDERAVLACPNILKASEDDFYTEYLDYIISVKTVDSVDEAIEHINEHSTGHSESIITKNDDNARLFMQCIDSSSVYVNASTRFTDGGEFGLGAEIGISTQKLHARGPMGLAGLTSTKYLIYGNGQVR